MGVALDAPEFLTSWTRTLNEADALALLDSAHEGMSVKDWAICGDRLLPQASSARRRELIRIVREELLDSRDGLIVASAWRRLLQEGSPHRRLGLLYGRLWRGRPLVLRAVEEVIHPALSRADRPLAPHDADIIDPEDWDRFLRACLHPDVPPEAYAKTRNTLLGALRAVGVLEISSGREREIRVRRGRPDPIAFAWVVARELRELGDAAESWAIRDSFGARLFAPRADYAAACIDSGVSASLLRRSHLMGHSQLQIGPGMF
jgi:hypothetical protein